MNVVVQVVVPIAAAAILFLLGLSVDISDFRRLAQRPAPLIIGLLARLVLVPALAVGLCILREPAPTTALGLLLVAACPLSTPTAALVQVAYGDKTVALTLTAVTSLASAVTLPLLLDGTAHMLGVQAAVSLPAVGPAAVRVGLVATVPVLAGMVLRRARPLLAAWVEPRVTPLALVVLIAVVGAAIYTSKESILPSLAEAGGLALALNVLATALAWQLGRLAGLDWRERVSVALAAGLYNFGLAAFVSLSVFRDTRILLPGIAYGLLMWGSAAVVAAVGRRRHRTT